MSEEVHVSPEASEEVREPAVGTVVEQDGQQYIVVPKVVQYAIDDRVPDGEMWRMYPDPVDDSEQVQVVREVLGKVGVLWVVHPASSQRMVNLARNRGWTAKRVARKVERWLREMMDRAEADGKLGELQQYMRDQLEQEVAAQQAKEQQKNHLLLQMPLGERVRKMAQNPVPQPPENIVE